MYNSIWNIYLLLDGLVNAPLVLRPKSTSFIVVTVIKTRRCLSRNMKRT